MSNQNSNFDEEFYEECKQKILDMLNDKRTENHAAQLCAAALNNWSNGSVIYQIQVLPAVDRTKLFGN